MNIEWLMTDPEHLILAASAGAAVISMVISAITAVIAWFSAVKSSRSARAAESSSKATEIQARVAHSALVTQSAPEVILELDQVRFRWAKMNIGTLSDQHLRLDGINIDYSKEYQLAGGGGEEIGAEVLIYGMLKNNSTEQRMVTVRSNRSSWRPVYNEAVFYVAGKDRHDFCIPGGEEVEFIWIDRHPLKDWTAFYYALNFPRSAAEFEQTVRPNGLSFKERLAGARGATRGRERVLRELQSEILKRFSFRVSIESRSQFRIPVVWTLRPALSAVKPSSGGHDAGLWTPQGEGAVERKRRLSELFWQLSPDASGPIDDDVVFYRYHYDYSILNWENEEYVTLPGRI